MRFPSAIRSLATTSKRVANSPCCARTGTYKKDTPIKLGTSGQGAIASSDTDTVLGYSQDDAVIASGETDFIRIRFRVGSVAAPAP